MTARGGAVTPARVRPLGPAALARRLAELPVRVDRVRASAFPVEVAGYGREPRPSSLLVLEGGGASGAAESVAWTAEGQSRFAERCAELLTTGLHRVGDLADGLRERGEDAYTRSAIELAALDLALRQASTNPFRLAGIPPRPVRFVFSFAVSPDPAAAVRELLADSPGARVKLDVDPHWREDVLDALAALGSAVAVLDLKLRDGAALTHRLHARFPEALLEDPVLTRGAVTEGLAARVAYDGLVQRSADVASLPIRPAAVNVKPGRVGGFLEALEVIAACRARGIETYVGGMFEVGPGRSQSQVLASLYSPEAWNDVAPLRRGAGDPPAASPVHVPSDFDGLGFAR